MSRQRISAALRTAVSARAANCCEYCRVPEMAVFFGHEPDHVIAEQHGGETILENLALACVQCNRFKGPNIASLDPETGIIVATFTRSNSQMAFSACCCQVPTAERGCLLLVTGHSHS